MDRERFRNRGRELSALAAQLSKLSALPERATTNDFRDAADLIRKAANDLDELLKAQPPGCVCRYTKNDDYDFLDYEEGCLQHRQLYMIREDLKAEHKRMERVLKNEARMSLVAAALSGTAGLHGDYEDPDDLAKRAIAIADEALERITRSA